MTTPPNDTDALRDVLAELAGGEAGDDPTPEELLDYLAGRLPPGEEERLQRRLVANPAAARMLVDLQDLAAAEPAAGAAAGDGSPADLSVHAGWRDLRRRQSAAAPPFRRLNRALAAAAAALALAAAGLGGWAWSLQQELRAMRLPVANLASLDLDASRRSAAEPVKVLEPGAPLAPVLAVPAGAEDCAPFRAVITAPSGGEQQIAGLVPNDLGQLTPLLHSTEPGRYSLRLSGCEPPRRFPEYRFRVIAGPAGGSGE